MMESSYEVDVHHYGSHFLHRIPSVGGKSGLLSAEIRLRGISQPSDGRRFNHLPRESFSNGGIGAEGCIRQLLFTIHRVGTADKVTDTRNAFV